MEQALERNQVNQMPKKAPFNPQDSGYSTAASDEIDVIDLIGFVWRWRSWFVVLCATGLVVANGLLFLKSLSKSEQPPAGRWDIELFMDTPSSSAAQIAPFTTMLQSPQFSEPFKAALARELPDDAQTWLTKWHSQWAETPGKNQYGEVAGPRLLMHIDGLQNPGLDELAKQIESTFQGLWDSYQKTIVTTHKELTKTKIVLLKSLGSLSFSAYKDFLNQPQYSQQFKVDMISSMMASSQGILTVDQYALVISSLTSLDEAVDSRIEKYESEANRLKQIQLDIEKLTRELPLNSPQATPSKFRISTPKFTPPSASDSLLKSVFRYNLLGLFVALFLAVTLTAIGQFIQSNRDRIRRAVAG